MSPRVPSFFLLIPGVGYARRDRVARHILRYQIDEQPALASGHTFRPDADSTRRTLERWPDDRHRPQDERHNPFGVWRFLAEGLKGLTPTEPVPTFVPPLVALLTRAEEAAGRPLTQTEVEHVVENGTCVAMELADAIGLERSWEQWQLVRWPE